MSAELVKVSTVRSFLSRQKATKDKLNNPESSISENIEDEVFEKQLAVDLEIQSADCPCIGATMKIVAV